MILTTPSALFQAFASQPVAWDKLKGWRDDNHQMALQTFQRSCPALIDKDRQDRPSDARHKDDLQALARLCRWLQAGQENLPFSAQTFFERFFQAETIEGQGLLTGYFEPEVQGSTQQTQRFSTPLYRRPDDLITLGRSSDEGGKRWMRQTPKGPVPYFDRKAIDEGALEGMGLELVWLEPVDAFFVHIQGSARIALEDGTHLQVSFAGKSGHPYTPIGRVLVEAGHLARDEVSMQSIRQWLLDHPGQASAIMQANRSYIFFQSDHQDKGTIHHGPRGAQGVPLTEGRSIAVDHRLYAFGYPFYLVSKEALPGQGEPLRRLTIAQDTGSAITGAVRADLFMGSGRKAGEQAGVMAMPFQWFILRPRHEAIRELAIP
jgi:membrane-bound lytic murein transglycosylase A